MENKSHAFWAGLFTVVLLAAIAVAAFLFNVDRSVRVPYDLIARTNVTGLYTDAAVRYRGLDVGKVQSIKFDRDHPGQILIRILVDTHAPITRSTFGSLGFQGVTGIAFIQLDDNGRDPSPLPSSAKEVAQLPMRPGLLDQLQQRGDVLLRKLEKVTEDVDNLLSPEMVAQLHGTAASIQKAADGVATLTQQFAPAAGKLPGTIDQLDRTLASTNQLITSLNRVDGPFETNLNKVGTAAQQAGDALTQMNGSLQELSSRVGYDTLPRVNSLAEDVRSAARSVDRAADTFSTNPSGLLFGGSPRAAPGPGEAGFTWPAGHAAAPTAAAAK
ncbi:MlaD family protein [Paraburkholderia bryophila]|jgi:phospholipid/cholesterol/gamma-HCH transport system substrate-binding protein|uniref:Phospholipid/cholesterol/gamma-HCH transport system substrate-binding protein n=1 Tax=Paraburkholderia bryophila TaxID=420952 RepID=A0A329BCD0_9BURK|nr:MlaD family protein [Paraburkholderia bryophila]RAS20516.1 phospholipid/cholesterol/gamma-HCH transport system substrate-binding protein [Paraburkholderia bryophila]